MEIKCHCCKEWSGKCKKRVTEWMKQYDKLEMYPAQYLFYYHEYRAKGIISETKNDKVLYNYLIDNYIFGESLCYLEIASKLVLDYYKNQIHKVKENIDSMLDYLYWSYGNPYDKGNLLRKYFVNKIFSKYKCNCKEEWENVCKKYTGRGLIYMDEDLNMIPPLYVIYFNEYALKGIISQEKNDEVLYEYIYKNNLLGDEICYYDLADKLCLKDRNNVLINHEGNMKFLVDYFYWAYGSPYDENNILKRALKDNGADVLNYKYKPKNKKQSNNIITENGYIRDARVRELALKLANFQCEIDKEHNTFVSNVTAKNYIESHHFIPMKYYDEFKYSIDNEANIVALCPNCHRLLHNGRFEDKKILLEKLYYKHIENLNKAGIEITLERLLEMYMN